MNGWRSIADDPPPAGKPVKVGRFFFTLGAVELLGVVTFALDGNPRYGGTMLEGFAYESMPPTHWRDHAAKGGA